MNYVKIICSSLLFLLLTLPIFGAVGLSVEGKKITAKTSNEGTGGLKGCAVPNLKKVPAYFYELMYKAPVTNQTCNSNHSLKWQRISKLASTKNEVIFDRLPAGDYKVIVLIGMAIGCPIKVKGQKIVKSIVQVKEVSQVVTIKPDIPKKPIIIAIINSKESITKPLLDRDIHVYPNPANNYLHINMKDAFEEGSIHLRLIDFSGNTILSQQISTSGSGIEKTSNIDLSQFPEGTYLLSLEDGFGNRKTKKILIIRDQK